jgi:hypothetical protein
MIELRTRKREMRGYGGNRQEKVELKRSSWVSQFTIPDTAGTRPDPACNYTDTRSSQPDQACCTDDYSYSYPPYRTHLDPPSLSFSSTTPPSSQNTMLSHPSLSLHAMIMSQHRVQQIVLAMVPFCNRFYYSSSMKTRSKAVRSGYVQNSSFN